MSANLLSQTIHTTGRLIYEPGRVMGYAVRIQGTNLWRNRHTVNLNKRHLIYSGGSEDRKIFRSMVEARQAVRLMHDHRVLHGEMAELLMSFGVSRQDITPDILALMYEIVPVSGRKRTDSPWVLILQVNDDIATYYRWWVDHEVLHPVFSRMNDVVVQHPLWGAHITILSGREDVPESNRHHWGKYDGQAVNIDYAPYPYQTWRFWSIPVRSKQLDHIKEELGFSTREEREYEVLPGFNYHITIGRVE